MGKHEVGTPKWIGNKIKSKGLQKLRWYCQMCEKQCRDENGFKCHTSSESHQRQLLLFGENPAEYLSSYSKDFEKGYSDILKRQYPGKRVHANVVYQQYIGYKEHVHMNSTCWVTLTSFLKHLGRTGKAICDETEKGWFITWIEKDQETLEYEARVNKKDKMVKDDEEKVREYIEAQIEKAKADQKNNETSEATELNKADDEIVKLNLKIQERKLKEDGKSTDLKNVFKDPLPKSEKKKESSKDEAPNKRKMSALEQIMEEEKNRKKLAKMGEAAAGGESAASRPPWLIKGIVVKLVAKSLGEKYYKKKGVVKEVLEDGYVGLIIMNDTQAKLKMDQEHLETVIPQEGRDVVILSGRNKGETAILRKIDTEKFSGILKLDSGDKITLPYEHFSKKNKA